MGMFTKRYDLDLEENSQEQRKWLKAVREFGTYIAANRTFILNYGDLPAQRDHLDRLRGVNGESGRQ